ncbi:uncharacterized protein LOC123314165 [Coccinella septempunctata]|uniref:uncharacterized protein LOC123314165 n=1 Tax=Coccinella septempunctata TaxID=41139 RepID=UPI001D06075F|nr:uncharacterized protein LOC123314165 [Coccinella septempunctata]
MLFNCYQVHRFNTAKKKTKKWSFKEHNYGLCYYIRDSRNISGIVGIFFFLLMMIIFLVSVQTKNYEELPEDNTGQSSSLTRNFELFSFREKFCNYDDKTIVCKKIYPSVMDDVQEEINVLFDQISYTNALSLTFLEIEDPEEVMQSQWLNKINVNINSLTIKNTSVVEIKAGSFEGSSFQNLTELHLISPGDFRLNRKSLAGAKSLSSLSIEGPGCQILSGEEEVFGETLSLSSIQILDCTLSPKVLRNLTGGEPSFSLEKLEILDLERNVFGKLLADSFSKLPELKSLYLQSSDLSGGLDPNVFRGIHPIQIYMQATQLTKLPMKIFDSIMDPTVKIYLSDNKFDCTCDFEWFQDFYEIYKTAFVGNLTCCLHNECVDLSTFSFCGSTSSLTTNPGTTSTITTESSSAGQPTAHTTPDNYDPTQCIPANRSLASFKKDETDIPKFIILGRKHFRFAFTQVGDEPKYMVSIDKILENDLVLIFMNSAGWIFCLSDLEDNFKVENLEHDQTYTVCIMKATQYTVSPKDCQSLTVPQEWGKRSWIDNDHKLPVVMGASTAIIVILVFSVCGIFTYVKNNPYLIYGKENVIIVEREDTKKDNDMNQNYDQPKYPPSLISWSDGYLTPKVYESVEEFSIPCIDQCPTEYLQRPRIFPTVRINNMGKEKLETVYSQAGEIYESINFSPALYYVNEDFSHKSYSTL